MNLLMNRILLHLKGTIDQYCSRILSCFVIFMCRFDHFSNMLFDWPFWSLRTKFTFCLYEKPFQLGVWP
jgi:hypothetical protein